MSTNKTKNDVEYHTVDILRPFGPRILKGKVPSRMLKALNAHCDSITKSSKKRKSAKSSRSKLNKTKKRYQKTKVSKRYQYKKNAAKRYSKKSKRLKLKAGKRKFHRIKKGNTLYSIARANRISVAKLKRINRLRTNTIKIGARLRLR